MFRTPFDIANRTLQILRRPAIFSFDDTTLESRECRSAYDQLRLAELRRAVWRFATRRVILRPLTNTSQILTPPAWGIATAYVVGDVVSYADQIWVAVQAGTGQTPGTVPASGPLFWDSYFGPLIADVWLNTGYYTDELVYKTPGDGTNVVYRSLTNNNSHDPAAVDTFDATVLYSAGQVVSYNSVNYQSLVALNVGHTPLTSPTQWTTTITSPLVSNSWRAIASGTIANLNIVYPLGVGPASDTRTRNCYRLPAGFLREAPTDPKAGINPYLGAPTGNMMTDWVFEGNYIISRNGNPIMLRFVADVQSVPDFDSMFSEGLASRMAIELAPRLADGEFLATLISGARESYARTMSEARTINGIETGPVDPVEDDLITCRL